MILLNTGIGLIVYGAPILIILLTLLVSIIEAGVLKKYSTTFWIKVKKISIANFISTFCGFIFILILNITNSLTPLVSFLTQRLNLEKFSLSYSLMLSLTIVVPNYLVTIFIEYLTLKKIWTNQLLLKDIALANLISYLTLLFIWILSLNL